ncbi:MAG: peptidylprolyl isomerase [Marmoricola sp.]|nr:peptidylprolyl isomerase [Marmoricola sp.]
MPEQPAAPSPYPPSYPAPAYPQQPPWGQSAYDYSPPPKTGTNGFSIAALIFGILPICFLGVVFAIVALVQISRSRQKGKGLAIAGLVLNGLWIIGLVTAVVIGALSTADRNKAGAITSGGRLSVAELRVGDCFNGDSSPGSMTASVDAVPCSELHDEEVFAVIPTAGDTFPGDSSMSKQAGGACVAQKDRVDGRLLPETAQLHWYQPSQQMWDQHHRNVICMVYMPVKHIGSVRK